MDAVTAACLEFVRRGRRLEHFTVAYNCLEGLVSIVAGVIAGSIALVGFVHWPRLLDGAYPT